MIRFINDFSKDKIVSFINDDLEATRAYHKSFKYLANKLPSNKVGDLNKAEWFKTKNYDYALIEDNEVSIIIRAYRYHFTLYIKHNVEYNHDGETYHHPKYHIGTFLVDDSSRIDYVDDYFVELNNNLPDIINLIRDDKFYFFTNNYSLKHIENVKYNLVLTTDTIRNTEDYIFALEELFRLHFEIFCQTEVVDKLNDLKVGNKFGEATITKIKKEDFSYGKEPYFHGIGIGVKKGKETDFHDVYSLARWHYDDLFGEQKRKVIRKFIIEDNGVHYGISYQPGMFLDYTHTVNDRLVYASSKDIEMVKKLLQYDTLDPDKVKIVEEVIISED